MASERRRWDSNPRTREGHTLSKRADSAALALLPNLSWRGYPPGSVEHTQRASVFPAGEVMTGSCATGAREPGQARNGAAFIGIARVPQIAWSSPQSPGIVAFGLVVRKAGRYRDGGALWCTQIPGAMMGLDTEVMVVRPARWVTMAAAAAVLVSCGRGGEPGPDAASPASAVVVDSTAVTTWGEDALDWFDALEVAAANGLEHLVPFIAADLVWEERLAGDVIYGSDGWFDVHSENDAIYCGFVPSGDVAHFVSADEVMRQHVISFNLPKTVSYLDRMEISADGLRRWSQSGSVDAGRRYDRNRTDFDSWDALADRYLAFWNGTAGVESLYHEDAVVIDSLLGQTASGATAIERAAGSGAWPAVGSITIRDLPHDGGRSVHIAPALPDEHAPADGQAGLDELRLVLDADDGTGCPGAMVVALGAGDGRVRWERRYHDVDAVRRCHEPASLRPGWWEGLAIPGHVHRERTGTVTYADATIEILNGTPELAPFVEWGFRRFDDAGLAVPRVASVTFLHAHRACHNLAGAAASTDNGADITLCRTADDICGDEACRTWPARHRQLLLHELAHPWLDDHADDRTRSEFLELIGLPHWWEPGDPWEERGVEWAAHAIAWGLMADPVDIAPELDTTCEERIAGFHILTGTDPAVACDAGTS